MAYSMTGFGRGETLLTDRRLLVEMKSVNNKYADLQIRLPRSLASLEPRVRNRLTRDLKRGKIDVFINYTDLTPESSQVICDKNLATAYALALREIAEAAKVADDSSAAVIARFNDVLKVETSRIDEDEVWQTLVLPALEQAIEQLLQMRHQEGEKMVQDIESRLERLHEQHRIVAEYAPQVPLLFRDKLISRIDTLLGDAHKDLFDDSRLATEVALYADKCAIDEELVRLKSHLYQFAKILKIQEPMGKRLDFLVQELNREINTIGSKANDLNLTQQVVLMKSELEKIREQIQNME